jgi:carboxymethylenebutenolidase
MSIYKNFPGCVFCSVLVPDLFRGNPWSKQKSKEQFEERRATHPPDRLENDIDTSTDWLSHALFEEGAVTKGLGIVGFCFGGGKGIQALARDTKCRTTTGVIYYGTRFDPALAVQIKVPLLLITGDKDPSSPVDVRPVIRMDSMSR